MSCSGNYKNCCWYKFLSKCCINILIIWHIKLQCQTGKLIIAFFKGKFILMSHEKISEYINSFLLECTFSLFGILLHYCKWGLLQLNVLSKKKKKKEAGCSLFGIFETVQVGKYWLPSIFAFCHQQMAVVALISRSCMFGLLDHSCDTISSQTQS